MVFILISLVKMYFISTQSRILENMDGIALASTITQQLNHLFWSVSRWFIYQLDMPQNSSSKMVCGRSQNDNYIFIEIYTTSLYVFLSKNVRLHLPHLSSVLGWSNF